MLGRDADPHGRLAYLARVRSGTARVVILYEMQHSDEGRRHGAQLAGLEQAVALEGSWRRRLGRVVRGIRRKADEPPPAAADGAAAATPLAPPPGTVPPGPAAPGGRPPVPRWTDLRPPPPRRQRWRPRPPGWRSSSNRPPRQPRSSQRRRLRIQQHELDLPSERPAPPGRRQAHRHRALYGADSPRLGRARRQGCGVRAEFRRAHPGQPDGPAATPRHPGAPGPGERQGRFRRAARRPASVQRAGTGLRTHRAEPRRVQRARRTPGLGHAVGRGTGLFAAQGLHTAAARAAVGPAAVDRLPGRQPADPAVRGRHRGAGGGRRVRAGRVSGR